MAIAGVVILEKTWRHGRRLGLAVGVALIALGLRGAGVPHFGARAARDDDDVDRRVGRYASLRDFSGTLKSGGSGVGTAASSGSWLQQSTVSVVPAHQCGEAGIGAGRERVGPPEAVVSGPGAGPTHWWPPAREPLPDIGVAEKPLTVAARQATPSASSTTGWDVGRWMPSSATVSRSTSRTRDPRPLTVRVQCPKNRSSIMAHPLLRTARGRSAG